MSSSRRPGTCQSNPSGCTRGEQHERHDHRDAVVVGARLEAVRERVGLVGLPPAVGESVVALVVGLGAEQVGARHREQVGVVGDARRATSVSKARVSATSAGTLRLVERARPPRRPRGCRVGACAPRPRRARGAARGSPGRTRTATVEPARVPVLLDERVPDEQLAREHRVDPRELDAPLRATIGTPNSVTFSSATAEPWRRSQRGSLKVRFASGPASCSAHAGSIAAFVRANSRLVSTSSALMSAAGGFFASADPGKTTNRAFRAPRNSACWRRPRRSDSRACRPRRGRWRSSRRRAARSAESSPASSARWMPSAFGSPARSADVQPERLREPHELAVQVLPLAHAQVVEELRLAHAPERAARELPLLLLEVVPEVEQGQEVARRVDEPRVESVGLLAPLERSLARILDRQARHDREHLARDALRLRLEHHAGESRLDRQSRELAADARELRPVAVACRRRWRRARAAGRGRRGCRGCRAA